MTARVTWDGVESAYAAAGAWVDCALRADGSLFTPGETYLDPGTSCWVNCTGGS